MTEHRTSVVVTGLGVVSPAGIGRDAFCGSVAAGVPGFREISLFDESLPRPGIAGEIRDFDPSPFIGKRGVRELDRSARLLCTAGALALKDAGVELNEKTAADMGITVGTACGSIPSISRFDISGLTEGPRFVNPTFFPNTVINAPAGRLAIRFGIKGFNTTVSTGFCSGMDAFIQAAGSIRAGRAASVLAGAFEELCEETFFAFRRLGCLSGQDGSHPRCTPYGIKRNGTILSEGAVVFVLEDETSTNSRGTRKLACLLGSGSAFDPEPGTSPAFSGSGLLNAIRQALSSSGVAPRDIDLVIASANGTEALDRMEASVFREAFGDSTLPPLAPVKSVLGETYSASGAFALASAVVAVSSGTKLPTLQAAEIDPYCFPRGIAGVPYQTPVRRVLTVASDPFGNNSAAVIGACEP